MALTQEDFVGAVSKLNELTRQQVIKWRPYNRPFKTPLVKNVFAPQFEPKFSFEADYEGRILRITEYVAPANLLSSDTVYKYTLDVRDGEGNMVFEFPLVAGIQDLFRSIQAQKLDIEGFIRKLVTS